MMRSRTAEPPDKVIPATFTAAELRAIERALHVAETVSSATGFHSFGVALLRRRIKSILRKHEAD